jgi:hypothetical protein
MTSHEVTRTTFVAYIGQSFVLTGPAAEPVTAVLVSADSLDKTDKAGAGDRESFSLVFCAPANARLPQQTYCTEHPDLGALDIFLVPIGPDQKGRGLQMEAVFNFRISSQRKEENGSAICR